MTLLPALALADRVLIPIPSGEFVPLYGTAKKAVLVSSFEIDQTPISNSEFLKFVETHLEWRRSRAKKIFIDKTYLKHWKSDLKLGQKSPPDSPVVEVSWFAAQAFCESEGKRLPTVNEWEFVASRPIEGTDAKTIILNWYSRPTPDVLPSIKTGVKNSLGVASLHGLIWEWTLDFNSTMVTGESRADSSLDKTMYCGSGAYGSADPNDYAAFLRFGFRSSLKANYTIANLGFRCVKDGEIK